MDVRLRPDRASMGVYKKAKVPDRGMKGSLGKAGIGCVWLGELRDVFPAAPSSRKNAQENAS